ncbi:MAG: GSCFA domain-containing protein, partial [Hymenobacteraceae bacterium]|nr:GSCFA domain-containing protein [Hymenobacteraceae bacterium]MDX5397027.1 GSCFA domain-containing protein [Hymenobacteraceae bacterium]MDX5513101.1 GSCFA domain-containing protein [Hymenobacteraceae bacterium]
SKVMTIGSCFSDVIGNKLKQHKVQTLVNPFGTLFNPLSVGLLLETAAGKEYDFSGELVQSQGRWYGWDFHSSLSGSSAEELLHQIHQRVEQVKNFLQQTDLLIITFGTAVAYQLKQSGNVVANCHKIPQKNFNRLLLPQEQVLETYKNLFQVLQQYNPKLNILLTVSPVRHVKETLEVNSVSKAMLRVLCHQLQEQFEQVQYFPSFEIMMDDMRDYRFYKADMLHPTEVAENYIWEKFKAAWFDKPLQQFVQEWEKLAKALEHKPFHPESEAHQQFLRATLARLEQLSTFADFSEEIARLREQLV